MKAGSCENLMSGQREGCETHRYFIDVFHRRKYTEYNASMHQGRQIDCLFHGS